MRVYRITHRDYAAEAYSGKGGLYAAGRWHSRGQLVAYASESLALAALEQIGRVGSSTRLGEMVYVSAELDLSGSTGSAEALPPAEVLRIASRDDLPEGWDARPAGRASQGFGDAWLAAGGSVALRVPSVMLPEGFNVVLNAAHPDFGGVLVADEPRPLELDPHIVERLRAPEP